MNDFHYKIFSRLEEIGESVWNELSTHENFYLSYYWLLTYPGSEAYTAFYILVLDKRETPVAAMPCYLIKNSDFYAPYNVYDLFFQNLSHVCREDCFPMLLCGTRSSYTNAVLWQVHLPMEQKQEVAHLIRHAIGELVEQWGVKLTAFLYLTPQAARTLLNCYLVNTPLVLTAANCKLILDAPDFQAYLGRFRSKRRWDIRREIRRFESSGYKVKRLLLSECADVLVPLFLNLQHRYGHKTTQNSAENMFLNQIRRLNEQSLVYLCLSEDAPVGFCLFFRWKQALYARLAGFDYDNDNDNHNLQKNFCYFNIVYYLPIMDALQQGIHKIYYGTTAYEAKIRHGCVLEPAWSTLSPTRFWQGPDITSQIRIQHRKKFDEWIAKGRQWGLHNLDQLPDWQLGQEG